LRPAPFGEATATGWSRNTSQQETLPTAHPAWLRLSEGNQKRKKKQCVQEAGSSPPLSKGHILSLRKSGARRVASFIV
jgi:hypothetical protein